MERIITLTLSLLFSTLAWTNSSYQIDLIVFAHPNQRNAPAMLDFPLIPLNLNAIPLATDLRKTGKPYCLLPLSYSSLRNEHYLLKHKSSYQILGSYSWRQPTNNQRSVTLSPAEHQGWQMQGIFTIKQSNYYSFDANIQLSPPGNPQSSFIVSQKQRLKPNVTYYLDNPTIGMLVKVHKVN